MVAAGTSIAESRGLSSRLPESEAFRLRTFVVDTASLVARFPVVDSIRRHRERLWANEYLGARERALTDRLETK